MEHVGKRWRKSGLPSKSVQLESVSVIPFYWRKLLEKLYKGIKHGKIIEKEKKKKRFYKSNRDWKIVDRRKISISVFVFLIDLCLYLLIYYHLFIPKLKIFQLELYQSFMI